MNRTTKRVANSVLNRRAFKKAISVEKNGIAATDESYWSRQALLLAHSLEKGMSMPNIRAGFGENKASDLADIILSNESLDSYARSEAKSVLYSYVCYRDSSCDPLSTDLRDRLMSASAQELVSGSLPYDAGYFSRDGMDAMQLLSKRRSVRSFKSDKVSNEQMNLVGAFVASSPSACNRQPWRIRWTCDDTKIQRIDELVPGNRGFEGQIPNWAVLSCDRGMFGTGEAFQWYVNGGIALAYFVEGLYLLGMDSCIFQLPVADSCVPTLKELLGIEEGDAVIAAIGFGISDEETCGLHPAAARRDVGSIVRCV